MFFLYWYVIEETDYRLKKWGDIDSWVNCFTLKIWFGLVLAPNMEIKNNEIERHQLGEGCAILYDIQDRSARAIIIIL